MSNQSHFLKIHTLLDKVNGVLRRQFLMHWQNKTGVSWSNQSVRQFEHGIGKRVFENSGRIQREAILTGDVNRWDTTLLTNVLIHLESKKSDSETNEGKKNLEMLKIIKKVRDSLSHHPSVIHIETELFNSLWDEAVTVFQYFGGSMSEINAEETALNANGCDALNITKAKQLRKAGNDMHRNSKSDEAILLYTKAISLSGLPNDELAILYSDRSDAYLKFSKTSESEIETTHIHKALQDAKEAVERNRTWFKGYQCAGNSYLYLRQFDMALQYFESAYAFCPTLPEIVTARDNCRMRIARNRREAEFNPANIPPTDMELVDLLKTRHGFNGDSSTDKRILDASAEVPEAVCPGAIHVAQGHEFRNNGNYKRATELYAEGAALGNAEGLYTLALLYKHGKGFAQDFKMCFELLQQAASQPRLLIGVIPNIGVIEAQYCLGLCYDEGTGVKEDGRKAEMWYKKASDHGCSVASYNLAFLFAQGRGVREDIEKALQYWRLSASLGNAPAMNTLANYYLKSGNDAAADEWHVRAIKHGSLQAKLSATDFEKKLSNLKKKNKELDLQLAELEACTGISSKAVDIPSRLENLANLVSPEVGNLLEAIKRLHIRGGETTSSRSVTKSYTFDFVEISKCAENGSKTAQDLKKAHDHFEKGTQALESHGSVYTQLLKTEATEEQLVIFNFSECYRLAEIVVQLPQVLKSKFLTILDIVLGSLNPNERSDFDRRARICYTHLNYDNSEHCLEFVKCSKLKYPEEICFHRAHVFLLRFLERYDEGVIEATKSIHQFPNDPELLYCRAVHNGLSTP